MTPAIVQARSTGIEFRIHEFSSREDGRSAQRGNAAAAVAALGLPLEHVFKTLIAKLDGAALVVAVVPVSCQLDLKRLASAAGARRASMAGAKEAERATGYRPGAISPLGQRQRLPVFIDESAFACPSIYVSGGRHGIEIELTAMALRDACDGRAAGVAKPDSRD